MASCNPYAKQKNTLLSHNITCLGSKNLVEYYLRKNYLKKVSINFGIFHGLECFQTEGPCSHSEGVWEWKFNSTNSYLDTRWGLHAPILVS